MQIYVLKFGGTSMADHKTWKQVLEIIKKYEHPIVVVSATARTTRQLVRAGKLAAQDKLEEALEIADEIKVRHNKIVEDFLEENPSEKKTLILDSCRKNTEAKIGKLNKLLAYTQKAGTLSPQMSDAIASMGEQISSYLLAQCGLVLGILTQHIEARKIIKTDAEYGRANPNRLLINQKCGSLETVLESGFTPIIGGFYGEAPDKTVTTLGFEGSDYTASLIGGAMSATAIEIWTDVSGVYTGDPRYIPDAQPLLELSYYDATEMAYFGAKVLHPSTLKPAQERNIPVWVKNMFEPEAEGTRIVRSSDHNREVLALSFKTEMAILTVSAYETLMGYSFLTKVFSSLKDHQLAVDAVNTTEASVTIALSDTEVLDQLSKEFIEIGHVSVERGKGLISVIGCTIDKMDGLSGRIFSALGNTKVDMISFTKEKRIVNFVVDEGETVEASKAIHQAIFTG
ncbi:aspartate kinase [Gracilimonas mengyeensis]|uniref:Aspartokinase n=1 Tax=Gracilimonas mengyeensis TaxID=1302730 RepID=A0A521BWQ1_9BACT|nr:aspartate kinase [Gracilimonas mengyeensis]SMO51576.1 aspartate kinase [Gracilimonas mengyeensis]